MESYEFEYYKIDRSNDRHIPLLDVDSGSPHYQYKESDIENPGLMLLRLGQPIPKKPKMADYHSLPSSVISKKIFDILEPLKISGIQLLPAQIRGKEDLIFKEYWLLNIYNEIRCIDLQLSDCKIEGPNLSNIKKIILDKAVLSAISLRERLIFRLAEDWSYQLFHSSIVDKIMEIKPEGLRFTNIEEWNDSTLFK